MLGLFTKPVAQVTETDMYYLEDEDMARQLVELGYRGSGDTLTREEFEAQKKVLRERNVQKAHVKRELASANKDLSGSPFLVRAGLAPFPPASV